MLACLYKDETETGNCAWKVSGTQGIAQTLQWKKAGKVLQNRCECLFVFTFLVFDLLLKIIKARESLKQIIYTHVPCTSDIMPKWTWLSLESFTGKKIWFTNTPTIFKYIYRSLVYFWKLVTSHGRKATKGLQKEETRKGSKRRQERKWAATKSKLVESSSCTRPA